MKSARLLVIVAVTVVTGIFSTATSWAGDVTIPFPDEVPGPIEAALEPPSTFYIVHDTEESEDFGYSVYWDETTAGDPSPAEFWGLDPEPQSCGTFFPNATDEPLPAGELIYAENQAVWDHPNGEGEGFCPHGQGTSHPGLVVADVWPGWWPPQPVDLAGASRAAGDVGDGHFFPSLPFAVYHCEYEGSESGMGTDCGLFHANEILCRIVASSFAIQFAAALTIVRQGNNLVADLGKGETCSAPLEDLETVSILGSDSDDFVELEGSWMKAVKIGINLGGGDNGISVVGTSAADKFGLHAIPPMKDFVGGLAFDLSGDRVPEVSAVNMDYVNVHQRGGADRAWIYPSGLPELLPRHPAYLFGGGGSDAATIVQNGPARYNFGTGPIDILGGGPIAYGAATGGRINLNGSDDQLIDLYAVDFEDWTVKGSKKRDVMNGSGGAGTGSDFRSSLKYVARGGNDKLVGGKKDDFLNGGKGADDLCKGGDGRDDQKGCETTKSIP